MSIKRVLNDFPYGIKSCDGSMFVCRGFNYYVYNNGMWLSVREVCSGFDATTGEQITNVRYNIEKNEYNLSFLNKNMNQLIAKEKEMLTKKMMIFNAFTNEEYLPELSLMIARMCFELGVM
jgi:DNA-dependent RNA polymerase auxiliary subunit epsilon